MDTKRRNKPATRRPRTERPKRATGATGLTAERIRDEALRLIDQSGLDEFSTRKLGAALGCEAMAIYWYYSSKDALLDAVVESLVSKLDVDHGSSATWIDALRKVAHAYRKLAHDHPRAFPLLASRRFVTTSTPVFLETLFERAANEGVDERTVARLFRTVSAYANGVALDELAGVRERESAEAAEAEAEAEPESDPAPAEIGPSYPRLERITEQLDDEPADRAFEYGLELLLASFDPPRSSVAKTPYVQA
ncbi:Transcriptional regulator, TetR family [Labilithrix luteola]|uniref:Transcriptional regulator, TetR family n=1 Tax=Labilithrix luteola TaxID=1391654 RepID=A0A0K1QAP0_9BACT|nr:TetR/AcrR family transcriptional regulator C-terminal domain-containing protein [Labilithrix luteola]AKV02856.1 Transcriptional regulator, TetR family [Labilithrix luteola]